MSLDLLLGQQPGLDAPRRSSPSRAVCNDGPGVARRRLRQLAGDINGASHACAQPTLDPAAAAAVTRTGGGPGRGGGGGGGATAAATAAAAAATAAPTVAAKKSGWLHERVALNQAMRSAPSHLPEGACDFAPPLELIGICITQACVTRMVMRGELEPSAAAYLCAALGCHTFTIVHHCTHESISQHNPQHARFENTVFRLAAGLIFFDDGYREAHRAHHQRTNQANDPDLVLAHAPLPVLGQLLHAITSRPSFASIGVPVKPFQASFLHGCGLLRVFVHSWLAETALTKWPNVVLKMALFQGLDVLADPAAYPAQGLARALQATWRGTANGLTHMLLGLFFARYPHRNGIALNNEVDSYYDSVFRGQGEVDLWMNGEGAHHMHHAKSDVSAVCIAQSLEHSSVVCASKLCKLQPTANC